MDILDLAGKRNTTITLLNGVEQVYKKRRTSSLYYVLYETTTRQRCDLKPTHALFSWFSWDAIRISATRSILSGTLSLDHQIAIRQSAAFTYAQMLVLRDQTNHHRRWSGARIPLTCYTLQYICKICIYIICNKNSYKKKSFLIVKKNVFKYFNNKY